MAEKCQYEKMTEYLKTVLFTYERKILNKPMVQPAFIP